MEVVEVVGIRLQPIGMAGTVEAVVREPSSRFWPALCRILYTASSDLVELVVDPAVMAGAEEMQVAVQPMKEL